MAAQRAREVLEGTSRDSSPNKDEYHGKGRIKRRKSEGAQISSAESDDGLPTHDNDDTPSGATAVAPTDTSPPPLPDEPPPTSATVPSAGDDGWQPVWDETHQAYYFFNRFSGLTTWTNPRIPSLTAPGVSHAPIPIPIPTVSSRNSTSVEEEDHPDEPQPPTRKRPHGGYDPSIHGDYDPNADYALAATQQDQEQQGHHAQQAGESMYEAKGTFNRFTGKWQSAALTPENFNDESKSRRQMNAFFDVDAAANSHDGKSLKAERSGKKLSKKEVKAFKDKRRSKKEEKRRAWLRD